MELRNGGGGGGGVVDWVVTHSPFGEILHSNYKKFIPGLNTVVVVHVSLVVVFHVNGFQLGYYFQIMTFWECAPLILQPQGTVYHWLPLKKNPWFLPVSILSSDGQWNAKVSSYLLYHIELILKACNNTVHVSVSAKFTRKVLPTCDTSNFLSFFVISVVTAACHWMLKWSIFFDNENIATKDHASQQFLYNKFFLLDHM